jgi:hypothetical protein
MLHSCLPLCAPVRSISRKGYADRYGEFSSLAEALKEEGRLRPDSVLESLLHHADPTDPGSATAVGGNEDPDCVLLSVSTASPRLPGCDGLVSSPNVLAESLISRTRSRLFPLVACVE